MADLALGSSALSAVLQAVFDRATAYAQQQLWGASAELKQSMLQLQMTLLIAGGMISDAENRLAGGKTNLQAWLANLKDVVYAADDVFDQMEYERLKQRVMKSRNGTAGSLRYAIMNRNPFTYSKRSFVEKIKGIQDRLDKLLNVASYFKLEMLETRLRPAHNDNSRWRMTSPTLVDDEENIFGRDKDIEKTITLLLDKDKASIDVSSIHAESSSRSPVGVIAIVGIGGLGKTTLAQLIFQDKEVQNHFELKVWVCVSDDFNVERIIQEILQSVPNYKIEFKKDLRKQKDLREQKYLEEQKYLREQLKEVIREKKFLLVLDDIWNEDVTKWNGLAKLFDCGKGGSKILITTRKGGFASKMYQWRIVDLEAFSDDDMLSLLMKHALCGDNNDQLQQIGKKNVNKLRGSPLAAKTIGRILSSELSVTRWNSIFESQLWELPQNDDEIMPALLLSYRHLPVYLKPCFAFCSTFPKDFQYSKIDIIYMWIALGMVQKSWGTGMRLEDIGNKYVNELLHMSMFEPCKDEPNKFVIHDLIHDMAKMVSKDEIFTLQGENKVEQMSVYSVRHLAVNVCGLEWDPSEKIPDLSNLRSLIFLSEFNRSTNFKYRDSLPRHTSVFIKRILSKARSLRIIDLSSVPYRYIPNCFSKLQSLRYLKLPHSEVTKLPSSIYRLYHLQVLSMKGRELQKWPHELNNLMNLRRLCTGSKHRRINLSATKIANIYMLTSLQELQVQVSPKDGREISALKDMKQIQDLCIRGPEYVKSKEDAIRVGLRHMKRLKSLKLHWFFEGECEEEVLEGLQPNENLIILSIRGYHGKNAPNWLDSLNVTNIQKISLKDCNKWEVLPPLGQIPCLKYLKLRKMEGLRELAPDFFCQNSYISYISIRDCPKLKFLFPKLPPTVSTLLLWHCPDIEWASTTSPIMSEEGWKLPPSLKKLALIHCGALSDMLVPAHLENLTCLEHLELYGCKSIMFLPPSCSAHLQHLELYKCDSFEILLTNAMKKLRCLEIWNCPKLLFNLLILGVRIPSSLTELQLMSEGFDLKLSGGSCKIVGREPSQLKACLQGLCNNETVTRLYIHDIPNLELFEEDMEDNMVSLKSLEELTFGSIPDLRSLPKKLCELSALTILSIRDCPKINALPDGGVPLSLKSLNLWNCPELEKRFSEEKHRVSHVSVYVQGYKDDKWISK